MKTRFNLSEIMTNAHRLFKSQRGTVKTFAECLREAWKAAKSYIGKSITMDWRWGFPTVCVQEPMEYTAAIAASYASGSNGRTYFGD